MSRHLPLNLGESLPPGLQQKFDAAISQIRLNKGAVIALSAGVDSSLVALLAHKALGYRVVSVTGVSVSIPPYYHEITMDTTKHSSIKHMFVLPDQLLQHDITSVNS